MKKYFIKNDAGQQGPFNLEELKDKGIVTDTPIWHEGLDNWTTAGQVEELRELIKAAAPVNTDAVAETKLEEIASTIGQEATAAEATKETNPAVVVENGGETAKPVAPVAVGVAPAVKAARKKGSTALTMVLSLLAIGGTGYYVYQDLEKNKVTPTEFVATDGTGTETADMPPANNATTVNNADTTAMVSPDAPADTEKSTTETTSSAPTVTAVTTTTRDPESMKKGADEKKKMTEQTKKKEEDAKKLLSKAKQEEEKKKLLAAQALAAKEMEMRNNWPRYVTIGSYKIEGDDKVKPFTIPVYNGYPVYVDKVTLRVDYLKKEKVVGTETLILMNIPSKGSLTALTTGNKKGKTANVYVTAITSKALHFCYPASGGKTGDPYYCN